MLSRLFRRCTTVAVLLILVLLACWPARAVASGWHCANGTPCRPADAPACCCTDDPVASTECEQETPGPQLSAGLGSCGCYYTSSPAKDAVLSAAPVVAAAPALLQPGGTIYSLPPAGAPRESEATAHGPPRHIADSGITRGPPVA